MKTKKQLHEILKGCRRVDAHVHTHLCDGKADMTVENIARQAEARRLDCVILTPHFHKRVSDETEILYTDTDESILLALREEIERYEYAGGPVRIVLSTEADILSANGETSLSLSTAGEKALDMVTPTMNYHPMLPLKYVHLTYGRDVNGLHESGDFARAAENAGGVAALLEIMYETEIKAIRSCPYPSMLGHFFAAHSVHPDKYTWFAASEAHISLMKDGARRLIDACREKQAMLDVTGVHMHVYETVEQRMEKNGFLTEFQRFVMDECKRQGVLVFPGSDAHSLKDVGDIAYYHAL